MELSEGTINNPKISVLMSVYNGEKYLRASIDSILNQTFTDFEFIIIDDGSRDSSSNIILSYTDPRIRLITNEVNLGLIKSLNKGLNLAQGAYIARQDADDLAVPKRFEKEVSLLDSNSSTVLVGSWMALIDQNDKHFHTWYYPQSTAEVKWALLFNSATGHSSAMYRTELARDIGGYSKNFPLAEDYDLWSRMSIRGNIENIPEILQQYRVHTDSVSSIGSVNQSKTRFSISKRNIQAIVSEKLDEDVLSIICAFSEPISSYNLIKAIDGFEELLNSFIQKNNVDAEIIGRLRNDVIERLANTFQSLDFKDRLICLFSRAESFPLSFWLRGQFLSLIISKKAKEHLRTLFGKRPDAIIRSRSD